MKVDSSTLEFCKNVEPNFSTLTIEEVRKQYIDNTFIALIELVVYQQISIKAGATVWRKLCKKVWPLTPENILRFEDDQIQECGLSFRKVAYLKNVCAFYLENIKTFKSIDKLTDSEIVDFLTKIKGVGPWTANIFMMFTLRRENHSTYLDLILKNFAAINLGLDEITEHQFNDYMDNFSPFKTTASLCLWAQSKKTN